MIASGVEQGEEVVTTGFAQLTDGSRIAIGQQEDLDRPAGRSERRRRPRKARSGRRPSPAPVPAARRQPAVAQPASSAPIIAPRLRAARRKRPRSSPHRGSQDAIRGGGSAEHDLRPSGPATRRGRTLNCGEAASKRARSLVDRPPRRHERLVAVHPPADRNVPAGVAVMLGGILGYALLPVASLPQVDFPTIQVTTQLPAPMPRRSPRWSRRRSNVSSARSRRWRR